jgi:uncharacterized protein YndB with AHSA1/START domain
MTIKNRDTLTIDPTGEREVLITRRFDAPRRLVYDAHTKPELVKRWLCPPGWQLAICEIDLRVGGRYRYVWQGDGTGQKMGMGGVYREIVAPARLVVTEKFDDAWYPGEAVNTTTFEESGGQTLLSLRLLYESPAARDLVLKSGMETGLSASYDQLEELVAAAGAANTNVSAP